MGYIEGLGYKIYRLREARVDSEYILYDIEKKSFNEYSYKKISEILRKEILNFDEFVCEILEKDINEFKAKFKLNENGSIKFNEQRDKAIQKYIALWIQEEHELLDNLGFYPIDSTIFEKDNKKYFNIYKIPETLIKDNYKLKKQMSFNEFIKKAPNHYNLFKNLHNNDDEAIKDTLYKLSDKIQNPNKKGQDCIIFYPGEGAGKGIFHKYILCEIFGKYASKVLMKRLTSDFNAFMRESLVLTLEEGKRDTELIEVLKEITTEGTILINEKGKNQQIEEIFFLTFVFSNNMNCIDLGKRRGSYHLCRPLGQNTIETSKKGAFLVENLPKETKYLLKYLHNLKIDHRKALLPYNTKAKEEITNLNKSPLELFYDYICSFPSLEYSINAIYTRKTSLKDNDLQILDFEGDKYISKDMIKETYNNFFIIEGFKSNLIKHNKDIAQLWSLMGISDDAQKRIRIKKGDNSMRRLDHIRLKDINKHIDEVYNEK